MSILFQNGPYSYFSWLLPSASLLALLFIFFILTQKVNLFFNLALYKILRKLDFSGVILLIIGSSFPLLVYGAGCVRNLANAYLFIMSFIGLVAFCLLVSGYFDPRSRQKKKSLLFGLFGVSFLIPITHILILE